MRPRNHENQDPLLALELHLFFARIMKEHALFLTAAFTPVNAAMAKQAERFMEEFEALLNQAATLGDGIVSKEALTCGELFTPFTLCAEEQTERFTGIPIHRAVTTKTMRMRSRSRGCVSPEVRKKVQALNRTAHRLLDGLIALKEQTLAQVLSCRMFTMNYPLLLEHIIREAKLYREFVCRLEEGKGLDFQSMAQAEQFWNQIMMEHALFIRGLLDPCEEDLVKAADGFAGEYRRLLERCRDAQDRALSRDAAETTCRFRDFKAAGAKGITGCDIRSVILPLLADHVLREANHYLRLLNAQT